MQYVFQHCQSITFNSLKQFSFGVLKVKDKGIYFQSNSAEEYFELFINA